MTSQTQRIAVRLQCAELIERLREVMRNIQLPGFVRNPEAKISDSVVIDFALVVADLTMGPDSLLISKSSFLEELEKLLNEQLEVLKAMSAEQRRGYLELLVASQAKIGSYDPDAPLRAAATPKSEN